MPNSRREFIRQSSLLYGAGKLKVLSELPAEALDEEADKLVLLGTQGGPLIRSYTQTPSASIIVYKKINFIIDCGYGTTFKLREAGVNLSSLNYIFITHHHSDHNLDLGPLLYNAWIAGLAQPIHVYGPTGLSNLLNAYWESNRFDIETRIKDEERLDIRTLVLAHEISEGSIVSTADFEVSALKNIHPPINESFAYRFKLGEKLVVFSGDTTYCPALGPFAAGADYLVHEVMYGPGVDEMIKRRPKNAAKLKASILSHHTFAEDVGRIAKVANVKNLVLNHFVPPDDKTLNDQIWINAVSTNFSGKIIVGKDMLRLPL